MKILVIRSASMERFDALAQKLAFQSGFDGTMDVLTHPHSIPSLKLNYPSVNPVAYPRDGEFCKSAVARMVKEGKLKKEYDEVIVLVGNLSGGGHFNVLRAATALSGEIRIFNINGELLDIPLKTIARESALRICLFPAVIFGTISILALGVTVLLACMLNNGILGRDG